MTRSPYFRGSSFDAIHLRASTRTRRLFVGNLDDLLGVVLGPLLARARVLLAKSTAVLTMPPPAVFNRGRGKATSNGGSGNSEAGDSGKKGGEAVRSEPRRPKPGKPLREEEIESREGKQAVDVAEPEAKPATSSRRPSRSLKLRRLRVKRVARIRISLADGGVGVVDVAEKGPVVLVAAVDERCPNGELRPPANEGVSWWWHALGVVGGFGGPMMVSSTHPI
ncbi:MAG: hypothetical protein WD294_01450 [Phycisphaeraceae bacterium]